MKKIKLPLVLATILLAAILGFAAYYFFIREDSEPNTETAPKTCTTYNGSVEEQCIEDYLGLTQEQAAARARQYGFWPKITSIDGVSKGNTDERGPIIFFVIEDGIVTYAYFLEPLPIR